MNLKGGIVVSAPAPDPLDRLRAAWSERCRLLRQCDTLRGPANDKARNAAVNIFGVAWREWCAANPGTTKEWEETEPGHHSCIINKVIFLPFE